MGVENIVEYCRLCQTGSWPWTFW